MWKKAALAITSLQSAPDNVEALRKPVGELRSIFGEYQLAWVSLMDFTALASSLEQQ